jgi:hypothetical protein
MRRQKDPRSFDQLTIFYPQPTTPQWESLPLEARERATKLIARLLQTHRGNRLASRDTAQEECDE